MAIGSLTLLTVENAGNDSIGIMICQTTHQRNGVFVGTHHRTTAREIKIDFNNDAGSGNPEVFINDDDLLRRPAERGRLENQGILTFGGLSIVLDLSRRGLSQIYIGNAVQMRDTDLGDIIHLLTPFV